MARKEESTPAVWNCQASLTATWTLQNRQDHFPDGHTPYTPNSMEHPPCVSHKLVDTFVETPLHGPNFTRPPPDLIDGEEEYEVDQIRSHRRWGHHKTLQYLIKWKGYPKSDNTWEDADQIHAPALIKLYHRTNALEVIKAQHIWTKQQHLPLLPSKSFSSPTTPISTILRPSTDALLWSETHENTVRSACNPHLALQVQSLSTPTPCAIQLRSSAILMGLRSTLQVSTVNNDNLLYTPLLLAPVPMHKCSPSLCTTPPTNRQTKALSNCHLNLP
jgi:hypothetical protein